MVTYSRLLIVGGGRGQFHLYEAGKELGLTTIMLDSRPKVLGTRIADQMIQNRPECFFSSVEYLNDTLIISDQSDFAQDWVFRIRKKIGQPVGMHAQLTDTGSDKARLRAHLDGSPLNWLNPKWIAASKETLPQILDKIPFDKGQEIVMKPLHGQGSEGVRFGEFQDVGTLMRMLENESGLRLFEEKLYGPQVSVDSISVEGNHTVIAVGVKRKFSKMPTLDETIMFDPASCTSAILDTQELLANELGIRQGFLHSEYALTQTGVRLIEFGLRGGGGGISSHVAPYLTDSSMTRDFLAHLSRDEKFAPPRMVPERRALIRFYTNLDRWRRARETLTTLEPRGTELLYRMETDFTSTTRSNFGLRKAVIVVGCDSEEALFVLEEQLGDR